MKRIKAALLALCLFAALTLWWGWVPFCIAIALLILSLIPRMHLWPENAFRQYKIDQ